VTAGTAGFVTTGLPSAASVGASSAASNAISKISSQGNTIAANKKPSTIVSGKPISSSRSGSPRLRLTTAKSAFAALVNSTMASVISARRLQSLAAYLDAQHAQPIGAKDKANPGEHDRPAEQGPLDPACNRAVDQKENGQQGSVLIHF